MLEERKRPFHDGFTKEAFCKTLVLTERKEEGHDRYSFTFSTSKELKWKPGQHGVFWLDGRRIKHPLRPFSIASCPDDPDIMITTTITGAPSPFKKGLDQLQIGQPIQMIGPVGRLYKRTKRPKILLAMGIGITPFPSIIKDLDKEGENTFRLLYLDKRGAHLYQEYFEEMDLIRKEHLLLFEEREAFIEKTKTIMEADGPKADYYMAGPPKGIAAIIDLSKAYGIGKRRLHMDKFRGY